MSDHELSDEEAALYGEENEETNEDPAPNPADNSVQTGKEGNESTPSKAENGSTRQVNSSPDDPVNTRGKAEENVRNKQDGADEGIGFEKHEEDLNMFALSNVTGDSGAESLAAGDDSGLNNQLGSAAEDMNDVEEKNDDEEKDGVEEEGKGDEEEEEEEEEDEEDEEDDEDFDIVVDSGEGGIQDCTAVRTPDSQIAKVRLGSSTSRWQRPGFTAPERGVSAAPTTRPGGVLAMLPTPTHQVNATQKSVYDIEFAKLTEKPWLERGADITEYFNYGFNEDTWKLYCERQVQMRLEASMLAKIKTVDGDGSGAGAAPLGLRQSQAQASSSQHQTRKLQNFQNQGSAAAQQVQQPQSQPQQQASIQPTQQLQQQSSIPIGMPMQGPQSHEMRPITHVAGGQLGQQQAMGPGGGGKMLPAGMPPGIPPGMPFPFGQPHFPLPPNNTAGAGRGRGGTPFPFALPPGMPMPPGFPGMAPGGLPQPGIPAGGVPQRGRPPGGMQSENMPYGGHVMTNGNTRQKMMQGPGGSRFGPAQGQQPMVGSAIGAMELAGASDGDVRGYGSSHHRNHGPAARNSGMPMDLSGMGPRFGNDPRNAMNMPNQGYDQSRVASQFDERGRPLNEDLRGAPHGRYDNNRNVRDESLRGRDDRQDENRKRSFGGTRDYDDRPDDRIKRGRW